MKKVVVLKIDDYQLDVVKEKIQDALLEHFPFDNFFSKEDKILLKPNLLMPSQPSEAIVTHPVIIEAVGSIFKERGFSVFVADSPGGFTGHKDVQSVYESLGIKNIAERQGFELLYPTQSLMRAGFPLCWWTESFKMINIPKLKTHDIAVLTLAVKNLYGCISGLHKSCLHREFPRTDDFMGVLIKLYLMIKPALNIVDGILALEGEGPAKKGKPKKLGVVVIGDDALYTDYVIGKLLKIDDRAHPLIKKARAQGLITDNEVQIISEDILPAGESIELPPPFILNRIPRAMFLLMKPFFKFRPVINRKECRRCLVCKKVCPKSAISLKGGKVFIDYKKCIMCMCCGEMCCFGAVDLAQSFFLKILGKLSR